MRLDLVAEAGVTFATGVLYLTVALLVMRRPTSTDARPANRLFATWWLGLSILYALTGIQTLAAAFGFRSLGFSVAWLAVVLVLICIALWGLLGYLLYLYTGSRRAFVPLAFVYGSLAAGLVALFAWWMQPLGFREDGFGVQLEYARQLADGPQLALGLAISLPIVAAAVAYGSLFFRVHEKAPRYRIAMVAGAFLFQFGWSVLSTILDLNERYPDSFGLYLWRQTIAVVVPILIILAYHPPRWIRGRLEDDEPAGA